MPEQPAWAHEQDDEDDEQRDRQPEIGADPLKVGVTYVEQDTGSRPPRAGLDLPAFCRTIVEALSKS